MWRGVALAMLGAVLTWGGCSTPQEKYRVLSFFFDGVPNPDRKVVTTRAVEEMPTTGPSGLAIASRHKPYLDNKCASCHQAARGGMMDFDSAGKTCANCHKKVRTAYVRMHGPVATGECTWCHAPHESSYPALLKDEPVKVCSTCHDAQLLGPNPPQHSDGKTSCITCHFGHGGTEANFLKAEGKLPWPAATHPGTTAPATGPAGAPATAPASDTQPDAGKGLQASLVTAVFDARAAGGPQ